MKRALTSSSALLWGLQFAFLNPVLALLLVTLFNATTADVGWVLAVYNAGGFIASLVIPGWADRSANYLRPMLACGVLTVALAGVLSCGYTMEPRFLHPTAADLAEWRELNTRWFQFGAFSPIFRSHGENIKREIFEIGSEGSPTYDSMVWYDRLRYRLMPYIYTLGADTYFRDGTIMRGLVMDFASDRRTWNIADEYMFGAAFLVAPVTRYKARSRKVYLPAHTLWYDFYSGRTVHGGQTIEAAAPYEHLPLFVRAGSIVPIGPAIQHTGNNSHSPVTLDVYTGANGSFSLYEDDGISRQYMHGQYSRIPLSWNERTKILTIGARDGSGYSGMAGSRLINIRWMRPGSPRRLNLDRKPDSSLIYTGRPLTVRMR